MNTLLAPPYILYLCAVIFIFVTTLFVKIITDKNIVHQETGRKILHFTAIMVCAVVVYYTQTRMELGGIFLIFSFILMFIAHQNILLPSNRRSYGIALFPLAFGIMLFTKLPIESILFGMVTLGISDALAGFVGAHFAQKKYIFLYEKKSWLGFSVFYVSTLCIGYFFIGFTPLLVILALTIALSELFSIRGSDNLSIPIIGSFWLLILQESQNPAINWISFLAMLLIFGLAYYKRWLSMTGTTAGILLGTLIIFSTGPIFLSPLAIFFITGSLSSKLHPKSKDAAGRNAFQVFANGLIAVLTLLSYYWTRNEVFLVASLTSVAVSLADTLSSDIGVYFKHRTFDIITLQPVKPGLSGGISLSGTLAGMIGAFCFSWVVGLLFHLDVYSFIIISVAGIAGMFLDSIIGSLWQAKYAENGKITEEKNNHNILIKGNSMLDNDGVNLIANIIVVSAIILIYLPES